MSDSISTKPWGNNSHSFCTVIMCFTLPNSQPLAQPIERSRSGYFANSASKSIICPFVLSNTRTFVAPSNGRVSELSNTTTRNGPPPFFSSEPIAAIVSSGVL